MTPPDAAAGGEHYFTAEPASVPRPNVVTLSLPDMDLRLRTDSGVFSRSAVDPGTKLLLSEAPAPPAGPRALLDLGCGYGPIAVTLARRAPAASVWALDVNRRALSLAAANAAEAGVGDRVRAVTADEVPVDLRFHAIYSNPPARIGKAALHELLATWLARLVPGGCAFLVVHKHLGSDSLARWLAGEGFVVNRLVSRMGYRLLEVAAP